MEPQAPSRPDPGASADLGSMSLFELPVSRGARTARVVAVLALDLILAGAGIAMILSYLDDREAAATRAKPPAVELEPPPPAEVESLEPETVDPEEVKRAPTKRAPAIANRPSKPPTTKPPADPPSDPAPPDSKGPGAFETPDAGTRAPDPFESGPTPDADPGIIEDDPGEADRVDFSARAVRRVVDQHTVQLTKCYTHAAKQGSPTSPLEGRVDVQFVIMPDGTASNVTPVANTTGSEELAECVSRLIESWAFPSPGAEEIAFVWPFVFKAP